MPFLSNRTMSIGLAISLLTALSAVIGAPRGFDGFTVPVWELLLQLNLCTGFVFLILGVLQSIETPTPDLRPALQLLVAAFVAYGTVCVTNATSLSMPFPIQLFLFTLSMACLVAGWARLGFSVLKQFDDQR